jgi:hypothetical protein
VCDISHPGAAARGEEAQTIFLERSYEEFQKQTAEQAREDAHRQEEIGTTTGDPTVAIE